MARVTLQRLAFTLAALVLARPMLAQCPDGTPPPCAGTGPAPRSVAVLTFDNITRDTTAQYLAEGLADQIFTRLAQVDRLTVISRSAVRRLRNADQLSVQQMGRSLNAAYLVSGSIRMAGGRVHINVEALRAASGAAIWSSAYDRAQDDLLGLEELIATEVASGIGGRLTPQEQRGLTRRVTDNAEAYRRLLRGNVLLARRTVSDFLGAIAEYQAAIEADPALVQAHARLAYAYALCSLTGFGRCIAADSALALGRRAADRAVSLDPRSSDAWLGRAYTMFLQYGQYDRDGGTTEPSLESLSVAFGAFRRSVELDPRNDEAWHQYGASLSGVNDSASVAYLRRAIAIDPTRAISYRDLSLTCAQAGRSADAVRLIDSAVALDPANGLYQREAAEHHLVALLAAGDTAGAREYARAHEQLEPSSAFLAALGGDSTGRRGWEARAAAGNEGRFSYLPFYLMWSGQPDAAVSELLRLWSNPWRAVYMRMTWYEPLRADPRFRALLASSQLVRDRVRWR
jgi:TolB-like protein/Tfp pilus assembly protein PilF